MQSNGCLSGVEQAVRRRGSSGWRRCPEWIGLWLVVAGVSACGGAAGPVVSGADGGAAMDGGAAAADGGAVSDGGQGVGDGGLARDGGALGQDGGPGVRVWSADASSVIPWQPVVLSDLLASFGQETYPAQLGSSAVTLRRVNETSLILLTPELPPGTYALTVTAEGVAYAPLALQLGAKLVLSTAEADAYFSQRQASLQTTIDTSRATALGHAWRNDFLDGLQANLDEVSLRIPALDATSRAELASVLRALEDGRSIIPRSFGTLARFAGYVYSIAAVVEVTGAVMLSLPVVSAVTLGLVVAVVISGKPLNGAVDTLSSIAEEVFLPAPQEPVSNDSPDSSGFRALLPINAVFEAETKVPLSMVLTNVSQADVASTEPVIQDLLATWGTFEGLWVVQSSRCIHPLGVPLSVLDVQPLVKRVPIDLDVVSVDRSTLPVGVELARFAADADGRHVDMVFHATAACQPVTFSMGFVYDDGFVSPRRDSVLVNLTCCDAQNQCGSSCCTSTEACGQSSTSTPPGAPVCVTNCITVAANCDDDRVRAGLFGCPADHPLAGQCPAGGSAIQCCVR